jgi:hypothetical protein
MEKKPLAKIVAVVGSLCLVMFSCVVCFTALPTKQPEVEIKPSPSVTETTAPPTRTPLPIPTETSCDPNRVLAYLQKLENDRLTIKTTAEEIVANPQLLNNYAYTRAALNTATKMDKYYEKPEPQACLAKLHSKAHFVFSSWSLGWGFVKLGDFDQADINFQMTAWFAEDLTAYLEEVSESLRNP